ncbi:MAG: FHA domain-containing protein [Planctomycetes bacterium]|nr:FHA domain-containing protein [Planctomycetota bacterium]
MARLILESGAERTEYLVRAAVVVGRQKPCDIVLDDPSLSREHMAIGFDGQGYFVRDLESRNGTRLNGKAVTGAQRLHPGDRIQIGHTTFVFQLGTEDAGRPESPAPEAPPPPRPAARPREREPLVVQGPGCLARMFYWFLLLAVGAGVLLGARELFTWLLLQAPSR